jgi:hypothetical protein
MKAIKEMLQRLDALIMEESQMMVSQTLEVVSGLGTNTVEVMYGVHRPFTWLHACYLTPFRLRFQQSEEEHPTNPGCACLTSVNRNCFIL